MDAYCDLMPLDPPCGDLDGVPNWLIEINNLIFTYWYVVAAVILTVFGVALIMWISRLPQPRPWSPLRNKDYSAGYWSGWRGEENLNPPIGLDPERQKKWRKGYMNGLIVFTDG